MIRRFALLFWKDLLAQRIVLLASTVVLGVLGLLAWLGGRADPAQTNDLSAARGMLILFVPLVGLVLGHRMVVREYQAHTQLFLEALPIRRWEMVVAKYLLGAAVLSVIIVGFVWCVAANSTEGARAYTILAARAGGFTISLWSVFFTFGLLGRLRIAAYLTLLFGVLLLDGLTGFQLDRFGPVGLINSEDFAYEREVFPVRALLESLALSAAFFALGLGLALFHEGSLAERLTRRASTREVVALTVLVVSEAVAASWVESKQKAAPFAFTSATVVRSPSGAVEVMYGFSELEPAARALAGALEQLRPRWTAELEVHEPPVVRVAHNSLLARHDVRDRSGGAASGVLLETNLGTPDLDLQLLLQNAAHSSFVDLSRSRALYEPNHWLLDGFSVFFTVQDSRDAAERQWLRALAALRHSNPDAASLTRWERVLESAGESGSNAVAFTLLSVCEARYGRAKTLELARQLLTRPTVSDLVSWLRLRNFGIEQRFEAITGEPWTKFVEAWRAEVRRRAALAPWVERLSRVPDDRADLRVERSRTGVDIVYRLFGPALPSDRECMILYLKLPPFDRYVPNMLLTPRRVAWKAGQAELRGRLLGVLQKGDRALVAAECEVPALHSPTRLNAVRFESP